MPELVWGDIPTWLTSIGSLGALIFAVIAAVYTKRTFDGERKRDLDVANARLDQDAYLRRSQAALVSAWWGRSLESTVASQSTDSGWGAYLRNASEAPIYKAQMTVSHSNMQLGRSAMSYPVVAPDPSSVFSAIQLPTGNASGSHGDPLTDYRVSLRFTDAAGLRWIRDEYGALKQLDSGLIIWTSPETAKVIEQFTDEFLASYGVAASFDTSLIESELERHFLEAMSDPDIQSPDILVGAHDWVGNLVKQEAIEPIVLTDGYRLEFQGDNWTLDALSYEGKNYGIPSSMDTVALIRNLDLAPDAPDSFEQLIEMGRSLLAAGEVEEILAVPVGPTGDPFHLWPLISSAGGWLFGRRGDGSWDSEIRGIGTPETIEAFEKIRNLSELGILRSEMTNARAISDFLNGQTAFLFATSGVVSRAREIGMRFAVSAVPQFQDGRKPQGFVAVYGFFVSRQGRNRLIAADLAPDYLSRPEVVEQFGRSLHVVPRRVSEDMDPAIRSFHDLCCHGVPMPAFAQMRDVWTLLGQAEIKLIHGEGAESVANKLADEISALFS